MQTVTSGSNVPIVMPLSVSCSAQLNNQLYATVNMYDATSGTSLGSAKVTLQSTNNGMMFSGQQNFNLPSSVQGHTIQVSASIYNTQDGSMVATSSMTFQVASTVQQPSAMQQTTTATTTATTTVSSQAQNQLMPSQGQPMSQGQESSSQTVFGVFGYVAVAIVLAIAAIAIAGIVVHGRRQSH
jgi:cobalamin biosynthesis Mg chelatase CobN